MLLSPLHVDRLSKAQSGIGWRPQHISTDYISTDFWLSTIERKVSAGASKSSECSGPASGERFDTRTSRSPCGDSTRLRMPFGVARRGVSQSGLPLVLPACARAFRRTAMVALVSATPPATPRVVSLEIMRCQLPGTNGGPSGFASRGPCIGRHEIWPTGFTRIDT